MIHARLLAVLVLAGVAACGGGGSSGGGYSTGVSNPGGGTSNPGTATNTVTLSEASFQPGTIAVPKGTTVTWKWADCADPTGGYGTCVSHSVMFDDGSNLASAAQSQGTWSRTFATAGTFKYHCGIHGTAMSGQVNVQ